MVFHFYLGLFIIAISEILLFLEFHFVKVFFTPLAWTGYLFLIDGVDYRLSSSSFIMNRRREFLLMLPLSAAFWYVFEFFNLFLKNWAYEGLPSFGITLIGMTWSFSTIGPALIETENLIISLGCFRGKQEKITIPRTFLYFLILLGIISLSLIILTPPGIAGYLGVLLWLGFFFIFDPINYLKGNRSVLRDREILIPLFLSGLICGFFWEFWNFWAEARWVYTLPYSFGPRIFEM
ncbi:MAG TPA: hypothetical protein EYP24_03805, partial [bacterium (Candidatus Stahlbacteria)]|nr:hypothetical protein [Candidatus Stahlbacteria bacterium]